MANNNKHTGPNVPALRFPEFSGEWERYRLDECVTFLDEKRKPIKSSDRVSEKGLYPYYGASGIIDRIDNFIFDDDLVLLSEDGANILDRNYRVAFIVRGKAWINNHAHVLKPNCHTDIVFLSESLERIDYAPYNTGTTMPKLNQEVCRGIMLYMPTPTEQAKIGSLLKLVNERIEAQSKIIEELTALRSALLEKVFQVSNPTLEVGAIVHQTSERNKLCRYSNVLSVSNRFGFINQSEQFEDRNVASDDVRNYKVVHRGDFAYNPARINVGSIAMLKSFESGIVSPMYICFQVDDTIVDPSFFELFLETKAFKDEMEIRLEGSVRRCLSFEALCEIHLPRPALLVQRSISDKIGNISAKIKLEDRILRAYIRQKEWLLKQMFI